MASVLGIEQQFSCELTSDSEGGGTIQWFEVVNGKRDQMQAPPVRVSFTLVCQNSNCYQADNGIPIIVIII